MASYHLRHISAIFSEFYIQLTLYNTTFLTYFSPDEEKLDERAKMSVAAKRSLFRVHFLFYGHFNNKNR